LYLCFAVYVSLFYYTLKYHSVLVICSLAHTSVKTHVLKCSLYEKKETMITRITVLPPSCIECGHWTQRKSQFKAPTTGNQTYDH